MLKNILFLTFVITAIQYGTSNKCYKPPPYDPPPEPPTTPKCGPNEEFINNKTSCPGDSCKTKYVKANCVANQPTSPGCVCQDGYLRNANGSCIPKDQCLSVECVDDPNAVNGCGNRCQRTCRDYKDKQKACTRECSTSGCDCPSQYVYDENIQRCVPQGNCTTQCTGAHEEYTTCLSGQCRAKTCDQLGYPLACPRSPRGCQDGCICKEGYVRCSTGECIDAKTCPSCGNDTNAVTGCGNPCGNSCTDFYKKSYILCTQYCEINGCDCRDTFVYDAKVGKCVKPENCSDYGCPGNSSYVSCNAQCPTDYCPEDDGPKPQCSPPNPCNGGCQCNINYRLNSENNCILARECPPINCTRPNEVFDSCPSACLAEQCDDRDNQPSTCNTLIENCDPRCICKPGTWRDQSGVCVTPDQCPPKLAPYDTST
nr:zonadhesin-like 4 [Yponomeuta cagnagella]